MTSANTDFDTRAFRRALGNFATGITVVTATAPDGRKAGVTANSFNSVSMDPPLILWSIDKRSSALDIFKASSHFAVNILASDQSDLSNNFAKPQDDKYANVEHLDGLGNAPIFEGVSGYFECETYEFVEGGDHWIIIGKVANFMDAGKPPLVYHQGAYSMVIPHPRFQKSSDPEAESQSACMLSSPLGDNLFYLMIQAVNASHNNFVKQQLNAGMRNSESRLLLVLDSAGSQTTTAELQRAVAMPAREIEEAMHNLKNKGLLKGDLHQHELTGAGHEKLKELWDIVRSEQERVFANLNDSELEIFKKALRMAVSA
ncbi:flavin reductase [Marinobacter pelagius]|uniref:p-hydroxyphenylacetate 3-hydroxylase reductase component n=1 Tax=Marinobacter sp. C7 TaxID=2951363 RepID=UPI001EF12432|nr:flavin reductase [Marinobacter sp. C7]MCG7200244.1 flavin reductase [Marinobacter sp. C7]